MSAPTHQIVLTPDAPGPWPALSQGTIYGNLVFTAGSLGTDPKTKKLVEGTIADRTTQALTNLKNILEKAGSGANKVLKVLVFVTDMADVPLMNEAYIAFFPEPRPARSCVCVKALAQGTDVEIECVGYI